jgi:hypothetical protein
MKKTLFFWKPAYRVLCWVGRGLKSFWMVAMSFNFSPSERSLLISYWYDYRHYRSVRPERTIDQFLDIRVQDIKRELANPELSAKSRQLYGDLLQALRSERIRVMFVEFLHSSSPRGRLRARAILEQHFH